MDPHLTASHPTASPRDPTVIGAYRILGRLGQGGMATVYLAEHTSLGRKVALKLMHSGMRFAGSALERFQREAKAVARLDHVGICGLYEVGEHEGEPFMAMRYVQGESLAQMISRTRANEDAKGLVPARSHAAIVRVAELIERAARALHEAHEHGLVHRDIKPSNLMVSPTGEPVILDFGVALDESSVDPALTLSGQVVGTPLYMAPEQLIEGHVVDRRADVRALALVLYECLTLVRPFEGPTQHEIWRRVLHTEAPNPQRYNRLISRDLRMVIATAMHREPQHRYRTALDFAEDLRCVRERLPIAARRVGTLYLLRRWVQRNPMPTALGGVLIAGITLSTFFWLQAQSTLQRYDLLALGVHLEHARREEPQLIPAVPEKVAAMQAWLATWTRTLLTGVAGVDAAVASLRHDAPTDERGRFLLDNLRSMADDLTAFRDGAVRRVEERLAWATVVHRRTLEEPALRWRRAIAEIADRTQCPAYEGLHVTPQLGLIPLQRSPHSGLWEFLVAETGDAPSVDTTNDRYVVGETTGVILVLLPGGRFTMGAEPVDRLNDDDEYARVSESERPQHLMDVAPFFLAKYEVTQAQWQRIMKSNPSLARPDRPIVSQGAIVQEISPSHPVEGVSWLDCQWFAARLDLCLPTEAQWEYGARGGTETLWCCGDDMYGIAMSGNALDAAAAAVSRAATPPWNDGYAGHAPVGKYQPNAFGLHDVIGNVNEWCADRKGSYDLPTEPGTGLRLVQQETDTRVARGGSWRSPPFLCRSASRRYDPAINRGDVTGLRLARRLRSIN